MSYSNNMVFAIRTILLEKEQRKQKQYSNYKFTIAAGAVLNALSAIRPNNTPLVELTEVLDITGKEKVEEFLRILRNGLAHKDRENFAPEADNENQIVSINIKKKRALSIDDFHSILLTLEQAIEKSYKGLYDDEKAKLGR